jgi:hypothetical protein
MINVAGGAKPHANKSGPTQKSSDAEDLRESVSDLADSVGDMATPPIRARSGHGDRRA